MFKKIFVSLLLFGSSLVSMELSESERSESLRSRSSSRASSFLDKNVETTTALSSIQVVAPGILHRGIKENNCSIIRCLLQAQYNPNEYYDGEFALECAIRKDNLKAVQMLVEHKADVHYKNIFNDNSLFTALALIRRRLDILNQKEYMDLPQGYHVEAPKNGYKILEFLLKNGADSNSRGFDQSTPIMHVSDVKSARVLLEYGADIHAQDKFRNTVINYLQHKCNYGDHHEKESKAIKYLVSKGVYL